MNSDSFVNSSRIITHHKKVSFKGESRNIQYVPAQFDDFLSIVSNLFEELPQKFSICYYDKDNDQITVSNDEDIQGIDEQVREFFIESKDQQTNVVFEKSELVNIGKSSSIQESTETQTPSLINDSKSQRKLSQNQEVPNQIIDNHNDDIQPLIKEQRKKEDLQQNQQKGESLIRNIERDSNFEEQQIPSVVQVDILEQAVHPNTICDFCQKSPIIGVRYQSTVEKNFDLCQVCQNSINYPYALIKITKPEQYPALIAMIIDQTLTKEDLLQNFLSDEDRELKKKTGVFGRIWKAVQNLGGPQPQDSFSEGQQEPADEYQEMKIDEQLEIEKKQNKKDEKEPQIGGGEFEHISDFEDEADDDVGVKYKITDKQLMEAMDIANRLGQNVEAMELISRSIELNIPLNQLELIYKQELQMKGSKNIRREGEEVKILNENIANKNDQKPIFNQIQKEEEDEGWFKKLFNSQKPQPNICFPPCSPFAPKFPMCIGDKEQFQWRMEQIQHKMERTVEKTNQRMKKKLNHYEKQAEKEKSKILEKSQVIQPKELGFFDKILKPFLGDNSASSQVVDQRVINRRKQLSEVFGKSEEHYTEFVLQNQQLNDEQLINQFLEKDNV